MAEVVLLLAGDPRSVECGVGMWVLWIERGVIDVPKTFIYDKY